MLSLKALYELKRQSFLIGFIASPKHFEAALAFAYQYRIAPIFHETTMRSTYGEDPFDDAYGVKREVATEITDYLDELWQADDFDGMGFRKLEHKFLEIAGRADLISILQYARLSNRFDDHTFAAITSNAPWEVPRHRSEFTAGDVKFD